MPLTAEATALLDQMAQANLPDLETLPPVQCREVFDPALLPRPEDLDPIHRTEDLTIPGPGGDLGIRVYAPESSDPLPALTHYHGGGWVLGNLDTHDSYCRTFANAANCIVVAVNYRRSPEATFPEPLDDCYAALRWLAENGASIGADTARLGVVGDSAGGNLAAATALKARDEGQPALKVQILTYPAVDATMSFDSINDFADGPFLTKASMEYFWGHYLGNTPPTDGYASPLLAADHRNLPPTLVITAEFDPLRGEGEAYAEKLAAAGVDSRFERYDGMFHPFSMLHKALPEGMQAIESTAAFVRKHMGA